MSDRHPTRTMSRAPVLAILALAAAAGALAPASWARAAGTAIDCTNPASGATWQIVVDEEKGTVDSFPAEIDGAKVKWRDSRDGWIYKLDRDSGKLTVYVASATGGWLVFDRCKPGK